jgi:putative cell wall-binding protein
MTLRTLLPLALALLLTVGIGAPPVAAAETTATLTVVPRWLDARGEPTTGDLGRLRTELWTSEEDGVGAALHASVGGVSLAGGGITYRGLTPGSYATRTTARGWAPNWFGDTPFSFDAAAIRLEPGETRTVEVEMRPGAVITGTVSSNASLDAYLRDPVSGRLESMRRLTGVVNLEDSYVLDDLPGGEYVLRGEGDGEHLYSDRYWRDSPALQGSETLAVAVGSTTTGIDLSLPLFSRSTDRLAGSDRYETAVLASRAAFSAPVPVLYVASGANWPDALSAGPAASLSGGALLITDPTTLPRVVEEEVRRLHPDRIVVVGSALSVSRTVEDRLRTLAPEVDRIGGRDRYETSRMIVADAFPAGAGLYLTTGTGFPDALSVAPVAGSTGAAVLLVDGARGTIDRPTFDAVRDLAPRGGATIVGGEGSVSRGVEAGVTRALLGGEVHRIAGSDRIETSRLVGTGFPHDPFVNGALLARADTFADALGASAAAVALHRPIYLTDSTCIRFDVLRQMQLRDEERLTLLGGPGTLSSGVADATACG